MGNKGFHIGAQNDALYIIHGEAPALNNDYPRHDAGRTAVALVYDETLARELIESSRSPAGYDAIPPAERHELLRGINALLWMLSQRGSGTNNDRGRLLLSIKGKLEAL